MEQQLYRWVKASERLPGKGKDICFKLDGGGGNSYYDTGHYTGSYIVLNHFGSKKKEVVIDWSHVVMTDDRFLKPKLKLSKATNQ